MELIKSLINKFKNRKYKYCKIHKSFDTYQQYAKYYGNNYRRKDHIGDGPLSVDFMDVIYGYEIDGKTVTHRFDGPAIIDVFGHNVWIIHDRYITNEINMWAEENGIDLYNLTNEDKALIKLFWGS